MFQKYFNRYLNNFKGFSKEIWILALVTFINRAGTMVLPFLTKYLKDDLHFSYSQVGTIMVFFGLGSMAGSWLGGKLSDKVGFYRIMVFSLFVSGVILLLLQFLTSFVSLCAGMFVLMTVADMYRPAMFVSLGAYATAENRTRALTLVRLAINLGFGAGPAIGGLLILLVGYQGLFWADGGTCILAIVLFVLLIKEVKISKKPELHSDLIERRQSVFSDKPFWVFLGSCMVTGVLFFQLFTTIPLYHTLQFGMTELQTGLLLTFNGLLVFLLEMPIVGYIERKKIDKVQVVNWGCFCMAISMFLMLANFWAGMLVIMMTFMTFGEMFSFPFSNSFAISRAPKGHEGRYMAIFTMSFSLAHIISAKLGMTIIDNFGYQVNWIFMGCLGLVGVWMGIWVTKLVQIENDLKSKKPS